MFDRKAKRWLILPHPLSPPLHYVERGTGGEVFQNINFTKPLKLLSLSKTLATKVEKTLKFLFISFDLFFYFGVHQDQKMFFH
jgi:hypothetical protein